MGLLARLTAAWKALRREAIRKMVSNAMARGEFDAIMQGRFGFRPQIRR